MSEEKKVDNAKKPENTSGGSGTSEKSGSVLEALKTRGNKPNKLFGSLETPNKFVSDKKPANSGFETRIIKFLQVRNVDLPAVDEDADNFDLPETIDEVVADALGEPRPGEEVEVESKENPPEAISYAVLAAFSSPPVVLQNSAGNYGVFEREFGEKYIIRNGTDVNFYLNGRNEDHYGSVVNYYYSYDRVPHTPMQVLAEDVPSNIKFIDYLYKLPPFVDTSAPLFPEEIVKDFNEQNPKDIIENSEPLVGGRPMSRAINADRYYLDRVELVNGLSYTYVNKDYVLIANNFELAVDYNFLVNTTLDIDINQFLGTGYIRWAVGREFCIFQDSQKSFQYHETTFSLEMDNTVLQSFSCNSIAQISMGAAVMAGVGNDKVHTTGLWHIDMAYAKDEKLEVVAARPNIIPNACVVINKVEPRTVYLKLKHKAPEAPLEKFFVNRVIKKPAGGTSSSPGAAGSGGSATGSAGGSTASVRSGGAGAGPLSADDGIQRLMLSAGSPLYYIENELDAETSGGVGTPSQALCNRNFYVTSPIVMALVGIKTMGPMEPINDAHCFTQIAGDKAFDLFVVNNALPPSKKNFGKPDGEYFFVTNNPLFLPDALLSYPRVDRAFTSSGEQITLPPLSDPPTKKDTVVNKPPYLSEPTKTVVKEPVKGTQPDTGQPPPPKSPMRVPKHTKEPTKPKEPVDPGKTNANDRRAIAQYKHVVANIEAHSNKLQTQSSLQWRYPDGTVRQGGGFLNPNVDDIIKTYRIKDKNALWTAQAALTEKTAESFGKKGGQYKKAMERLGQQHVPYVLVFPEDCSEENIKLLERGQELMKTDAALIKKQEGYAELMKQYNADMQQYDIKYQKWLDNEQAIKDAEYFNANLKVTNDKLYKDWEEAEAKKIKDWEEAEAKKIKDYEEAEAAAKLSYDNAMIGWNQHKDGIDAKYITDVEAAKQKDEVDFIKAKADYEDVKANREMLEKMIAEGQSDITDSSKNYRLWSNFGEKGTLAKHGSGRKYSRYALRAYERNPLIPTKEEKLTSVNNASDARLVVTYSPRPGLNPDIMSKLEGEDVKANLSKLINLFAVGEQVFGEMYKAVIKSIEVPRGLENLTEAQKLFYKSSELARRQAANEETGDKKHAEFPVYSVDASAGARGNGDYNKRQSSSSKKVKININKYNEGLTFSDISAHTNTISGNTLVPNSVLTRLDADLAQLVQSKVRCKGGHGGQICICPEQSLGLSVEMLIRQYTTRTVGVFGYPSGALTGSEAPRQNGLIFAVTDKENFKEIGKVFKEYYRNSMKREMSAIAERPEKLAEHWMFEFEGNKPDTLGFFQDAFIGTGGYGPVDSSNNTKEAIKTRTIYALRKMEEIIFKKLGTFGKGSYNYCFFKIKDGTLDDNSIRREQFLTTDHCRKIQDGSLAQIDSDYMTENHPLHFSELLKAIPNNADKGFDFELSKKVKPKIIMNHHECALIIKTIDLDKNGEITYRAKPFADTAALNAYLTNLTFEDLSNLERPLTPGSARPTKPKDLRKIPITSIKQVLATNNTIVKHPDLVGLFGDTTAGGTKNDRFNEQRKARKHAAAFADSNKLMSFDGNFNAENFTAIGGKFKDIAGSQIQDKDNGKDQDNKLQGALYNFFGIKVSEKPIPGFQAKDKMADLNSSFDSWVVLKGTRAEPNPTYEVVKTMSSTEYAALEGKDFKVWSMVKNGKNIISPNDLSQETRDKIKQRFNWGEDVIYEYTMPSDNNAFDFKKTVDGAQYDQDLKRGNIERPKPPSTPSTPREGAGTTPPSTDGGRGRITRVYENMPYCVFKVQVKGDGTLSVFPGYFSDPDDFETKVGCKIEDMIDFLPSFDRFDHEIMGKIITGMDYGLKISDDSKNKAVVGIKKELEMWLGAEFAERDPMCDAYANRNDEDCSHLFKGMNRAIGISYDDSVTIGTKTYKADIPGQMFSFPMNEKEMNEYHKKSQFLHAKSISYQDAIGLLELYNHEDREKFEKIANKFKKNLASLLPPMERKALENNLVGEKAPNILIIKLRTTFSDYDRFVKVDLGLRASADDEGSGTSAASASSAAAPPQVKYLVFKAPNRKIKLRSGNLPLKLQGAYLEKGDWLPDYAIQISSKDLTVPIQEKIKRYLTKEKPIDNSQPASPSNKFLYAFITYEPDNNPQAMGEYKIEHGNEERDGYNLINPAWVMPVRDAQDIGDSTGVNRKLMDEDDTAQNTGFINPDGSDIVIQPDLPQVVVEAARKLMDGDFLVPTSKSQQQIARALSCFAYTIIDGKNMYLTHQMTSKIGNATDPFINTIPQIDEDLLGSYNNTSNGVDKNLFMKAMGLKAGVRGLIEATTAANRNSKVSHNIEDYQKQLDALNPTPQETETSAMDDRAKDILKLKNRNNKYIVVEFAMDGNKNFKKTIKFSHTKPSLLSPAKGEAGKANPNAGTGQDDPTGERKRVPKRVTWGFFRPEEENEFLTQLGIKTPGLIQIHIKDQIGKVFDKVRPDKRRKFMYMVILDKVLAPLAITNAQKVDYIATDRYPGAAGTMISREDLQEDKPPATGGSGGASTSTASGSDGNAASAAVSSVQQYKLLNYMNWAFIKHRYGFGTTIARGIITFNNGIGIEAMPKVNEAAILAEGGFVDLRNDEGEDRVVKYKGLTDEIGDEVEQQEEEVKEDEDDGKNDSWFVHQKKIHASLLHLGVGVNKQAASSVAIFKEQSDLMVTFSTSNNEADHMIQNSKGDIFAVVRARDKIEIT